MPTGAERALMGRPYRPNGRRALTSQVIALAEPDAQGGAMTDTSTTTAPSTEALVETYLSMWRTTDAEARAALVAATFTEDGRHVDQHADATGHAELTEMIAGVHAGFPGFRMARTSGIDRFGDQLRFAWALDGADGTPIVAGLDVAEVGNDGRLQRVTGFWGDLPAA
jgi:hypothetical protein